MSTQKINLALLATLLVLTLTATYWNHFDNGFHFDDRHTVVNNTYIRDISNIPLIFIDAKTTSSLPLNQAYRPVITSLNTVDYWIAGSLAPKVFHWHIYLEFLLLLGLFNAVLLKIFELASDRKHYVAAMLGTAFFAFHTATAETINYIIARSDGFSTLMVLAGMLIYIGNSDWKKQLGLIPFIIGCLAKPTTLMLAPLLFLYDLFLESPSLFAKDETAKLFPKVATALKNTAGYFLLGAGMYLFTSSMSSDTWRPGGDSSLAYLNTQPYVVWIYIKTFFLPMELTADTDLTLIKDYLSPRTLGGIAVIFALLATAWRAALFRKSVPITFGILWFFVALAPSSSFVPLAEVMNHHRTFFPYLGLVMAVAWASLLGYEALLEKWPSGFVSWSTGTVIFIIIAAHAYGTYQRNEVWHDDETLWYDVSIKSPNNGRGMMNYGLTKMSKGQFEEAISYFEQALNTPFGKHPYLYINLGIASNALADRTNDMALNKIAENYLKQALRSGSNYPASHYYYGRWLFQNGRPVEAIKYLNRSLELSPAHAPSQLLLDKIYDQATESIIVAKENAQKKNTPAAYLNLSLKFYNRGQYEECAKASLTALSLRPDYAEAYNNLCSAYNGMQQFDQAIIACNKALEIKKDYVLARGNLNWAQKQLKKSQ